MADSRQAGKGAIVRFAKIVGWDKKTPITTSGTTQNHTITSDNVAELSISADGSFFFGFSTSNSTVIDTDDQKYPGGLSSIRVPHKLFIKSGKDRNTVFFHVIQDAGPIKVRIVEA